MAIAHMAPLTFDDLLLFVFNTASKTEKIESTCEKTFGMTIDKFYAELGVFLALPQEEQFEIICR